MTTFDLYAMGMESPTAYLYMRELCALLGVEYPPKPENTPISQKGLQPPVSAEFN